MVVGQAPPQGYDFTGAEELWLDYVADSGDGFDATTTIAAPVARDTLTLPGPGPAGEHSTRAGAVLVLGGDQAYPFATMQEYRNRLVGPFRSVLPWTWRPRWLFAIPGNHDWYDGLASFVKQFCQGRWIGGWKTAQTRSYFALALPHGWHVSNCGWTCTPGIHPAPLSPAPGGPGGEASSVSGRRGAS